MPTITLSPRAKYGVHSVFDAITSVVSEFENTSARFHIMQGAVPTDFTGLTSTSSRSSDILVSLDPAVTQATTTTDAVCTLSTAYATATRSGTATWFWWYVFSGTNITRQIVGTVGTSGTDLVIGSDSITIGHQYRIIDFDFKVPTDYTYS